jgi:histidinol-phosphate aminotransferase
MTSTVTSAPDGALDAVLALARPGIRRLAPYRHASWQPGFERLHANENPWRNPADTSAAGLNTYPEPHPLALEARLAELYGVAPAALIAGRGSDEAIDLLVRVFCADGEDAVMACPPTFGMYAVAAGVQGAAVVEVPLLADRGYALDVAGVIAAARATTGPRVKLVFLCTPNNPTCNEMAMADLEAVLRALAGQCLVVVDEAYVEFCARPSLASRLAEFPHLVVLRTLSKAYALAGARCGVAIGDPAVVELLRRVIPPYALPEPCIEAILAALQPAAVAVADATRATLLAQRARLAAALPTSPLVRKVWPSDANFLLVECTDAAAVLARAREVRLLLRDFSTNPRTPGGVRISIGTPDQNTRLLGALGCTERPSAKDLP